MPISESHNKIAKYFPLTNGKYDVKPGLFPLKRDFGNEDKDTQVFQIDHSFSKYRKNKLNAHQEQLTNYFCTHNLSLTQQQYVTHYLITSLCSEYPEFFILTKDGNYSVLSCKLTNETLLFSAEYNLIESSSNLYTTNIDALMMQVQEDIAIISEQDYISCLHLMAPNFWSAPDKIAKNFTEIHKEVAGIDTIIKNSKAILQAMIYKGPYVRFAWGLCSDSQLNHYTSLSDNIQNTASKINSGRDFDLQNPDLFLRVERQTITGMQDIKSALFTIRTYLYTIDELTKNEIHSIINAIESMTDKQLEYKGLIETKTSIIEWLFTRL